MPEHNPQKVARRRLPKGHRFLNKEEIEELKKINSHHPKIWAFNKNKRNFVNCFGIGFSGNNDIITYAVPIDFNVFKDFIHVEKPAIINNIFTMEDAVYIMNPVNNLKCQQVLDYMNNKVKEAFSKL